MIARVRGASVLGVLPVLSSACGGGVSTTPSAGTQQTITMLARPAKERIAISEFTDLPRYGNYYFQAQISGAHGRSSKGNAP